MALEHPRLLAASLTAAILGTSCSTPSDSSTPDATGNPDAAGQPTGTAGSDAPAVTPAAQDPSLAQDPTTRMIQRGRVDNYLETARALRANGDLQAAKLELLKAKEIDQANPKVLALLTAVQAELGEPAGRIVNYADEQIRLREINEERSRASVATQLEKAEQAMAEHDYAGAIEELRIASLTIELKDEIDWRDLPGKVDQAQAAAETAYEQQQRASQAKQNQELADRLRAEYADADARRRAQVDALLQQSQLAFEARRFTYAQELAGKAMQVDPQNAIAYELHNAAVKASRNDVSESYYHERARAIRAMLEADEDLKVPQTAVLEMDMATWDRARGRAAKNAVAAVVDPMDQAVWDKVQTTPVGKLTYTEETGDYAEVIKNLRLITGVEIIATPEAREIISSESLKLVIELVGSMTLRDFLNHMVGRSKALAWTVKNGVVLIGNLSQAAGTMAMQIHPVKDLVFTRTEFLPPRIRDIPGDAADDTPRTGSEGEEPKPYIAIADLVDHLKAATDPEYWNQEGVEIKPEDSGLLIIKATPEMQTRVATVLADLRRFMTPVVTVDSKFLTISRNFLQEFGFDFRGLGGSGNKGDSASLDDITNGLQTNASQGGDNGGTGDPAGNPLSGAFFNDGSDGDVRARTENYFTSDLGRVLSPTGGLTAGWTLIDDTQLNMILRAVEKQQDAEIVNSQILSVVNGDRGHVAVINQTAYVRDFDVEVAQAAFIADPKVDVIQDGIVLDVKPIIQHDRKYIILELNPTVAELVRPIPTFTTSLAGSTLPVTLQLPNLTVTNFSTTARVPDGGTVLLGGLRQVLTKERRAEVPLLARLPLVSFLFKQEGSVDENRSLMVMIRAQITDVRDAK
jgi:type II secretory pathway component GspD/PulD (secretin)